MNRSIVTALWKLFYACFMIVVSIGLPLLYLYKALVPLKKFHRVMLWVETIWGRVTVASTGSKVQVEGRELIPQNERLCFIGNHQGLFDIPVFMGYVGVISGFISKKELFRVPLLSQWMSLIPCVFIDRENPRKAMKSFQHSAEIIKMGLPLVIFPEGARSFNNSMGSFHLGSMKLALMSGATIVPFVIKGSWHIWEEDNKIHATTVKIRILPPIKPDNPIYINKTGLSDYIHNLLETNLKDM